VANYYSRSSFAIPGIEPEQAQEVLVAYEALTLIEYEDKPVNDILYDLKKDQKWYALNLVKEMIDRCSLSFTPDGFIEGYWYVEFDLELIGDQGQGPKPVDIWIYGEESFSLDNAAGFAQLVLEIFEINIILTPSVANTCDRPILDAFDGRTALVSMDRILLDTTCEQRSRIQQAHISETVYYLLTLPASPEHPGDHNVLLISCGAELTVEHLAPWITEHYGQQAITGNLFSDPIPPEDSMILEKYLPLIHLGEIT
jgi:hypothetical protein